MTIVIEYLTAMPVFYLLATRRVIDVVLTVDHHHESEAYG